MTVNRLYTCDNLFLLNGMDSKSVDLIYLDPPFNSKRTYSAPIGSKAAGTSFKDMWTWDDVNLSYLERLYSKHPNIVDFINALDILHSKPMQAYVTYMTQRLFEMRRVLKQTGSIYIHIDPTASHYLKIIMDGIFGSENYRNEIVWHYQTGGASKRHYSKKHDIILFYSNSKDYQFNPNAIRTPRTQEVLRRMATGNKSATRAETDTKLPMDVWSDINALNAMASERTGYPTQKPIELLERIVKSVTNKGDIVFDPFCGCATSMVAAQRLQRKWIGCDIETMAADILIDRLKNDAGLFTDFVHTTQPPARTDVENTEPILSIKERLYQEQDGECNACFVEFPQRNLEVDHIIPKSKGGGNYYENYQLLCGSCNRVKGDRPMEYLMSKVAKIRDARAVVSYG